MTGGSLSGDGQLANLFNEYTKQRRKEYCEGERSARKEGARRISKSIINSTTGLGLGMPVFSQKVILSSSL